MQTKNWTCKNCHGFLKDNIFRELGLGCISVFDICVWHNFKGSFRDKEHHWFRNLLHLYSIPDILQEGPLGTILAKVFLSKCYKNALEMHLRWSWGVFNAQIFEEVSKCTWFMHLNCAYKSTFQASMLICALLPHTLPPSLQVSYFPAGVLTSVIFLGVLAFFWPLWSTMPPLTFSALLSLFS